MVATNLGGVPNIVTARGCEMFTVREVAPSGSATATGLTMIGLDAIATAAGLGGALLLVPGRDAPGSVSQLFMAAAPTLLAVRLAAAVAARLSRWSLDGRGLLDLTRLVVTTLVATAPFAMLVPDLPLPVYALECLLTGSFMAAWRFALPVRGGLDRSRSPESVARFLGCERPRRVFNVLVALVGLVLTVPLCALITVAIKLTSRGPVLYRQERIGLDLRAHGPGQGKRRRQHDLGGRPFMMYKFRTMRLDAEAGTGAVWSPKDDPRVLPLGRCLRRCRLDELPQLLNVLKGDMNVVGPRPERACIFAELRGKIPGYQLRQQARPGITGYAQVNLEYDSTVEDVIEKLKFDTAYVRHQSVAMDLQIMAKTLPVMLFPEKVLATRARPVGPLASEKVVP